MKFVGLRICRAGHAPELFVKAEEILESGRCQSLGLLLDLHPFLCFHSLVEPFGPAPPRHGPPRVLVDDDDLTLLDDIVHVPAIDEARPQRRMDVMQEAKVLRRVEAVPGGRSPAVFMASSSFVPFFEKLDLTILLVDGEVPGSSVSGSCPAPSPGAWVARADRSHDRGRRNPPRAQK